MPAISLGAYLLSLPLVFLRWWFFDAVAEILKILKLILQAFLHLLSIELIFKTFFKPWKNEYREGLVRFSIFMGIFIKSLFLFADFLFVLALLFVEGLFLILWVALPFTVFWGIYAFLFTR
jgi:hypothetical protein